MKSVTGEVLDLLKSCWVFQKTNNRFSSIPIDQAHEQNYKIIKDIGGVIGLTEKPNALKKWMVSGPEQARLLSEFERVSIDQIAEAGVSHEEGAATFQTQVNKLFNTINTLGNLLMETSLELMTIDTHD